MLVAIRDCGWPAYLCILIGLVGALVGLLGVVLAATKRAGAARLLGGVAIAIGLGTVGAGFVGRAMGERATESVLEEVPAESKDIIRAEGHKEAGQCVNVGGYAAALPLLKNFARDRDVLFKEAAAEG